MRKMKWVPYAVFNYFPSLFSCTGIKYIGDPVDGIRFKSGQYRRDRLKNISFDFSQEEDPEAIDTVDVDARKNFKGKKMPEVESPVKDRTLGFDLMSLTSRRGHFVDHVSIVTILFESGSIEGVWNRSCRQTWQTGPNLQLHAKHFFPFVRLGA